MLTAERLRDLLNYDPTTGVFTWRAARCGVKIGERAGTVDRLGYRQIALSGKKHFAHRLAWLYVHGMWPPKYIDHINHDTDDNRIANLRDASQSQNLCNARLSKANTSGVKGVSYDAANNRWRAYVCVGRSQQSLGRFDTLEAAQTARRNAAERMHGSLVCHE